MTRPLILHQLNAVDLSPVEFIKLAATNTCEKVTLFGFEGGSVLPRSNTGLHYPTVVTEATIKDVQRALADTGVAVDGVEFFPLTADVDLNRYIPALVRARELGARRAVSHIFIEDDVLVVDKLGQLCELAQAEGLVLSAEFCPLTPGNPSLERAIWLVDQVGCDRFGIGVDALHLIRSGSTAEDIEKLNARYFGVVQICDAIGAHTSTDYIADVHNREVPGQGDLPLIDILNAVPASIPLEIEVPAAHRRKSGITAAEHVRDVVTATRSILANVVPGR